MRIARTFLATFVLAAAAFVAAPSLPASIDSQSWLIDWGADGTWDEAWIFVDEDGYITEI